MSETKTVPLYRIENPNIPAVYDPSIPHGELTSHPDIVGQWFTPNLGTAMGYLRKSTQTFGGGAAPVEGAQLVVAQMPAEELEAHHVSRHPVASTMDVEGDNYIIPRDGSIETSTLPLDETIGELRGSLGRIDHLMEAKRRIEQLLENIGQAAIK